MKKMITSIAICILLFSKSLSAGVDDVLSFVSEKNVEGYLKPLVTSLGVGLNSGMYRGAKVRDDFSFGFSFSGMFVFIPEDQKTFDPYVPEGYTSVNTATVYGSDPGYVYGDGGYISYPGGFDLDNLALGFPQVMLGWKGTEVTAKFIPTLKVGESGEEFYFYTFSAKHEFTRYLENLPVDGAFQVGFGKIKFSDQLEFNNLALNLIASKNFGITTLYGGLGYQTTEVEANYAITGDPDNADPGLRLAKDVSINIKGDNGFGITAGAALKLVFFVINADYTYNSQSVITTGLNLEF
ncbi:MAG: hypothetical protein JXN63_06125 [Candidatus Delongbacteria bacterium]|nr:hypothetical protein [Candidatus Delongbacteria bacterium]